MKETEMEKGEGGFSHLYLGRSRCALIRVRVVRMWLDRQNGIVIPLITEAWDMQGD